MASTAARAERLALAVAGMEAALAAAAAARGMAAPSLPTSRDPVIAQAMQLEAMAAFVRTLDAPEDEPAPERKSAKRKAD